MTEVRGVIRGIDAASMVFALQLPSGAARVRAADRTETTILETRALDRHFAGQVGAEHARHHGAASRSVSEQCPTRSRYCRLRRRGPQNPQEISREARLLGVRSVTQTGS
jgi:hypothetical protein